MISFQVGKTYSTHSPGDYNCIFSITVVCRTPKSIRTSVFGETKTLRVRVHKDAECVTPWGTHRMAPIVSAKDQAL